MEPVDFDELDRALSELPAPRAPRTLLPRVLAATVDNPAARPTGWLTWPLAWQVAIPLSILAIVVAGLLTLLFYR